MIHLPAFALRIRAGAVFALLRCLMQPSAPLWGHQAKACTGRHCVLKKNF